MASNAATGALPGSPVEQVGHGAAPLAGSEHSPGAGNGAVVAASAADVVAQSAPSARARATERIAARLGLTPPLTRRRARTVVVVGRLAAVFLPVAAVLATVSPLDDAAVLGTAILVTAIWFGTLESALAAARLSPLALGVPTAAAIGSVMGLALVSLLAFWVPPLDRVPPLQLFAMALGVFATTTAFEVFVKESFAVRRRVLVVGGSNGGAELVEDLSVRGDVPFDCIGVVDDEPTSETVAAVPILGRTENLEDIVAREQPDIVVLAASQGRAEAFEHLLDVAFLDFRVVGPPEFYEHAFGRVPVRHLSPVWFMSVLHLYQRRYSRLTKRALDVLLASLGLVLSLPVIALAACMVRASGPGPILFRQIRLGESGKTFEMLKFRTMVEGAEEPGQPIWAEERDPRVTSVGRFLRNTRIDELPQLWNVLRNEMSIIGPRPERPEFLELLQQEVPFWTRRHLVKPGVTGWAQVRNGYTSDAEGTSEKLSYDLYYLKHRSLVLDLAIIAKTVKVLFSGDGAR